MPRFYGRRFGESPVARMAAGHSKGWETATPQPEQCQGSSHNSLVGTPAFAGGVDLLSLLSPAKQRRVLEGSKLAHYPGGSVAFHPGPPARAFLLEKGLARVYVSVQDGRQATAALIHPGNLVGLFPPPPFPSRYTWPYLPQPSSQKGTHRRTTAPGPSQKGTNGASRGVNYRRCPMRASWRT